MFPDTKFSAAIEVLPLVSIDLCLVCDGALLLGKRVNKPAQGYWFTPGGRIRKDEAFTLALERIASAELGLCDVQSLKPSLMGVWDHFYSDSAFSDSISTHYVNLPHSIYLPIDSKGSVLQSALERSDGQHSAWCWMPLAEVVEHPDVHEYVRAYAQFLLERRLSTF